MAGDGIVGRLYPACLIISVIYSGRNSVNDFVDWQELLASWCDSSRTHSGKFLAAGCVYLFAAV